MGNFSLKYPQVKVYGFASSADISDKYTRKIFDTWSAVIFDLSEEQIATNRLIVDQNNQTVIDYKIRVSPNEMYLPDTTIDEDVYRDTISDADQWANSGYFTIQNFISTYSSSLYDDVDPNFMVLATKQTKLFFILNFCECCAVTSNDQFISNVQIIVVVVILIKMPVHILSRLRTGRHLPRPLP